MTKKKGANGEKNIKTKFLCLSLNSTAPFQNPECPKIPLFNLINSNTGLFSASVHPPRCHGHSSPPTPEKVHVPLPKIAPVVCSVIMYSIFPSTDQKTLEKDPPCPRTQFPNRWAPEEGVAPAFDLCRSGTTPFQAPIAGAPTSNI
ncbi:hypothetical protein NPIL_218221 [Nephila pilipes]|uniref:Uncharacterized protein n=1 Tax=Nephila pilipes TaxID=299642 RepID=A0A8X6P597_NEPPI|nr:hypothetical protein NPIL_218221 [Nephila pilipes]